MTFGKQNIVVELPIQVKVFKKPSDQTSLGITLVNDNQLLSDEK
jgi:hypothetical protein